MYFSGMRTVRCSGRLGEGGCLPRRVGVCLGGLLKEGVSREVSAQGDVCLGECLPGGCTLPPVDRQTLVKTLPFSNYCCGR